MQGEEKTGTARSKSAGKWAETLVDTRNVSFFRPAARRHCEGGSFLSYTYMNYISESWQFIQEKAMHISSWTPLYPFIWLSFHHQSEVAKGVGCFYGILFIVFTCWKVPVVLVLYQTCSYVAYTLRPCVLGTLISPVVSFWVRRCSQSQIPEVWARSE